MSKPLDYEKQSKANLVAKRGTEISDVPELSEKNLRDIQVRVEADHKKAAKLVDKIRTNEAALTAKLPKQQIAYIEHLYDELSPEHKKSSMYGKYLRSLIAKLRTTRSSDQGKSLSPPGKVIRK